MSRSFTFVLLLVVCLVCIGPLAAQDDIARVRMGFVALDPTQYDLYINGELAPEWASGFAEGKWMGSIIPSPWDYINCCTVTMYLPMDPGAYSIAVTPAGAGLDEAVIGPVDVDLEGDHAYTLAFVGSLEDGSANLLPIDETAAFADADPLNDVGIILVNNVPGLPSVYMGGQINTAIDYGSYAAITRRGGAQVLYDAYTDATMTTPVVTVDFPYVPARITEFHAMLGPLTGSDDTRNRFSFGHGYSGDVTVHDAGPITVGQSLEGTLEHLRERNRYTLELEAPARLNILAQANGPTTRSTWGSMPALDTLLYLYDSEGHLIFWNDEASAADDWTETPSSDSAITALPLEAGTYFIDVGAFTDQTAGPYRLTVEAVRPAA